MPKDRGRKIPILVVNKTDVLEACLNEDLTKYLRPLPFSKRKRPVYSFRQLERIIDDMANGIPLKPLAKLPEPVEGRSQVYKPREPDV